MYSGKSQKNRIVSRIESSPRKDICSGFESNKVGMVKKINNYNFKLSDIIGRGAFSTVYKGCEENTGEVVAIKVVELNKIQSPTLVKLLHSEVGILKSIKHPNVLKCYDVYYSTHNCYIITEYCNGGDLRSLISKQGALKQQVSRKIVLGIFQGLKYLDSEHIIHRDLKASNVLMKDGNPKIADFGFAKKATEPFKDVNIGSPLCMSPQGLIQNIYGSKTDVWAFGILLFEMFNGKTPFWQCKTQQQLKSVISKPIKLEILPIQISEDLKQLIINCLRIKSENRISIEAIDLSQYIKKIRQSFHVEEYRQYDSSSLVSTSIPRSIQATKQIDNQIDLFGNLSFENNKPQKEKNIFMRKTIDNKFSCRSPVESKFQSKFHPSEKKLHCNQSSFDIDKIRNKKQQSQTSLDFSDRKFTIMSNKKDRHLNSTFSNFKRQSLLTSNTPRTNIIQHLNNFGDILALLQYCRVLFKTIKLSEKFTFKKLDFLGSWLFKILDQLDCNIKKIIKPPIKIIQLKQIILDYHDKYRSQLPFSFKTNLTIMGMTEIIAQILSQIQSLQTETKTQAISYLIFLYDLTILMSKSTSIGSHYIFTKNCQIQQFLQSKEPQNKCN